MVRGPTQAHSDPSAGNGPGIGHNGPSEEVITRCLDRVQNEWRQKEADKQTYQAANARYRRCLKDAKAEGLNENAILDLIRKWQHDPADVMQDLTDFVRYGRNRGMPLGTQAEIFGDAEDLGDPADLGREKVKGRKRVGTKVMEKANPYPRGSWQAREFEKGWIEGARAQ